MKEYRKSKKEGGQSLTIFVILSIVFLGMLALVLDGGYGYFQRRLVQNAADAGALAGADILCGDEIWTEPLNRTGAKEVAEDYATIQNNADWAVATKEGERIVKVVASVTYDSFIGSILGQPSIAAAADATAGCYALNSGLGVLPIAWSCRPPIGEDPDADCEIRWMDEGETCEPLSDNMYVIMDSATVEEETQCRKPPNCAVGVDCEIDGVDCDIDDDDENDLEPLSGGNRAWLDLDGGGGGASSLSEWVENGFPDDIDTHYWFAGQTGVALSVYNTVYETQEGNDVIIPVFDLYCPDGPPDPETPSAGACPLLVHGNDTVVETGGSSTDYFHIISFAVFHITCVEGGSHGPCDGNLALGLDPNVKTIEGCFIRDYVPGGGGGPNTNPWVGAYTVYLID
jgi:hypothetical protein